MKHIIFFHLLNDRSGAPKVLSHVIKACNDKGFKTELFSTFNSYGFLNNKAEVHHQVFYTRSRRKLLLLFSYIFSQVIIFFQCFRYWNKNVIFYINAVMPFSPALAAKVMNKQVIYHIHETAVSPHILNLFLRAVIKLTALKIIFVSKFLKDVYRFNKKEQVVIYNALEPKVVKLEPKDNKIFTVLMICSLKKYKGVYEFLNVAKSMKPIEKLRFSLVLNASDTEINDFFKNLEMPSNLNIYARQKNVDPFIMESHVMLNLSRPDEWIETFGLTLLEGMQYGLPVISPPIGGPAEIVRHGVEGYLVSCYEIEKVAQKIKELMRDKALYETMSSNALSRSKYFKLDTFNTNIVKILESK